MLTSDFTRTTGVDVGVFREEHRQGIICIRSGNYNKHKAVKCPINVSLTLVGVDVGVLEGVDDGVYMKRQLI